MTENIIVKEINIIKYFLNFICENKIKIIAVLAATSSQKSYNFILGFRKVIMIINNKNKRYFFDLSSNKFREKIIYLKRNKKIKNKNKKCIKREIFFSA